MPRTKDVAGTVFGKLTAINPTEKRKWGYVVWRCECECGGMKDVPLTQLRRGQTASCGCVKQDPPKNYKPKGKASENRLYRQYVYHAKLRGYSWEITREQFRDYIYKRCFYCGSSPRAETNNGGNGEIVYNGIDRVDNSLGYFQENCVTCCKNCNQMKMGFSLVEFTEMIGRLSVNLGF